MFADMPALSHSEQQQAAERIHELMAQGLSSGQAIAQVAAEIRANRQGESTRVLFEDDEQDEEHDVWDERADDDRDDEDEDDEHGY
ncbi:MAG: YoaH family protein [Plesiomonas shigelloides]